MSDSILIAGPCAAESEEQILSTAARLAGNLQLSGQRLDYFRAGVWKPRSRPKEFKGAGKKAMNWLSQVQTKYGFPVCVEVANPEHIDACEKAGIKAIWIGSRTVVNPFVVQELADSIRGRGFTVMVKNPIIPDIKLWIGSIERFMEAGVGNILAIHRGFAQQDENVFRYSPLWEIPIELKVNFPDIPLLCDPSHIAGNKIYLRQLSQIALDFGFNGLMIESHCNPQEALSDAKQQITPEELVDLLNSLTFKSSITSPADDDLRKQRTLIAHIDAQISQLLAKRMSIIDIIGNIKNENNLPLVQPQQFNKVVKTYIENGLPDENYSQFIQKFLELLHQSSIQRQKKV
jgi:chorismate mutase